MVDVTARMRIKQIMYKDHRLQVNTRERKGIGFRCVIMGSASKHSDSTVSWEDAVEKCKREWIDK